MTGENQSPLAVDWELDGGRSTMLMSDPDESNRHPYVSPMTAGSYSHALSPRISESCAIIYKNLCESYYTGILFYSSEDYFYFITKILSFKWFVAILLFYFLRLTFQNLPNFTFIFNVRVFTQKHCNIEYTISSFFPVYTIHLSEWLSGRRLFLFVSEDRF